MFGTSRKPTFEVKSSPIQGLGGFATRPIRKGTRIIEYLGERITPKEADRRYDDELSEHSHVLLFTVDGKTVIDAGVKGNDAHFINHSCEPNCETVVDNRRVYIEALRAIDVGEELTYDYNLQFEGRLDAKVKARYACRCGTPSCRGSMLEARPARRKKSARKPSHARG
ncbi:MAG TPA: SET domain-containing protein-lysine N-methyltransferase [Anaerolineales bacterium]|jgi:hypothetical protein